MSPLLDEHAKTSIKIEAEIKTKYLKLSGIIDNFSTSRGAYDYISPTRTDIQKLFNYPVFIQME
nr:hypothetical protein [Allomuricauda sp.]